MKVDFTRNAFLWVFVAVAAVVVLDSDTCLVLADSKSLRASASAIASGSTTTSSSTTTTTTEKARNLQTTHCGCDECDDSVWNLPVSDYNGDYTCGERIEWFRGYYGVSEVGACVAVSSNEFPSECGTACNPRRCDGREDPYQVESAGAPIVSGDLSTTDDLYCFLPYEQRQRYTDVWDNNFIMEVKETAAPMAVCDPGANFFASDTASFQDGRLKLEFKQNQAGGKWAGSEVRLVLPDSEIFQYGTYEWSIRSVQIIDTATGSVVSETLPPRIVLGLFTWDTTETFGEKEKNNEVDIEISNFGDVGGPDVNFLVQPPGKPQQAKLYSGGGTSYNQGGHIYKFDWEPSGIYWYSTAAGGMSHEYTNDIITDLFAPPWLQCLPADIEIRVRTLFLFYFWFSALTGFRSVLFHPYLLAYLNFWSHPTIVCVDSVSSSF